MTALGDCQLDETESMDSSFLGTSVKELVNWISVSEKMLTAGSTGP